MKNRTISLLNIPLFVVFPFISFLIAIRNLQSRTNAVIFILFCTLFGYAFSFGNSSADSYRVALVFHEFSDKSIGDIYQWYVLGGAADIYRFLVYSIVKLFSNNPKIVFAVFGFVFGIFWYLSLKIFHKERKGKIHHLIYILLFIFIVLNPITNINGARFNTAIWIFFVATMNFLFYNKKRYVFLLLLTPLVHFSFLVGVFIVLLFAVFKKVFLTLPWYRNILFYIFIFSFCISWVIDSNIINLGFLTSIIPSDSISNKIGDYNSEEFANLYEKRAANSPFLMVSNFFLFLMKITFFSAILYFRKIMSKQQSSFPEINIYMSFILFYFSCAFILGTMPSGVRFLIIGYIFSIILFLKMFITFSEEFNKKYILLLIPIFSFRFFFNVVFLSFSLTSSTIWFGNVFWILYEGWNYKFIYL